MKSTLRAKVREGGPHKQDKQEEKETGNRKDNGVIKDKDSDER
jgi:hypothetical protein